LKKKISRKTIMIWVLLIIGLCAMEFPGVFFFGQRVYPRIFGLPFIYGYIICWWIFICCVLFYAYRTEWGEKEAPRNRKLFTKRHRT